MKTFKEFITEGKYDEFKKELINSKAIQEKLNDIKLDSSKVAENPYYPILTMKFPFLGNGFYRY